MRRLIAGVLVAAAALSGPRVPLANASAASALRSAFAHNLNAAGGANGAYVLDLATGKALYAYKQRTERLPASVEKLYTTATALIRFGPASRLQTTIYTDGSVDAQGVLHGSLYLRGGGDPTFGSASFDSFAYGAGATMQQLVSQLVQSTGIQSIDGSVIGDESYFDTLRGTAPYGYQLSSEIGGPLSALEYDRGLANEQGTAFQGQPALFSAQRLVLALRAAHVHVPGNRAHAGTTPLGAARLTSVPSPTIATLIRMTNQPSDNLFAELLLKGIGARFGSDGSSAAGAAVVKAQLAQIGIHPRLNDGSGLSRADLTSPVQVVTLLKAMARNSSFVHSLAVAARSGTLSDRMGGTAAAGRCEGKTGTLHDVSALAGYCRGRDGHTLAFAILQNQIDPIAAHPLQDKMAAAVASYNG